MKATSSNPTHVARWFHALSDETRIRVVEMLASGEKCVCDLQDAVGARAIAIKRIELTQQGLCEASVVAAERQLLAKLQAVSAYAISVDVMKMSGSGGTLVFRAVSLEAHR